MILFIGFTLSVIGLTAWAIYYLHQSTSIVFKDNSSQNGNDDGGWLIENYDGPDFDLPPGIYLESEHTEKEESILFV